MNNITVTFRTLSDLSRFVRKAKISESEIISNDPQQKALVLPLYLLAYAATENDLVESVTENN